MSYQISAIMSSSLVTFIALMATFYRYFYHTQDSGVVDWGQIGGTLGIVCGWVVAMEYIARYLHKYLWHDFEPGYALHKTHHEPRVGPFEGNDLYAIMFAIPAMYMCFQGFVNPGWLGTIQYASGLGITLYGNMYMFIHDGLVHKRFPVGPIEQNEYLRKVTVAHRMHHQEKYQGVPFGLFLGPQELEKIGAKADLDQQVRQYKQKMQEKSLQELDEKVQ